MENTERIAEYLALLNIRRKAFYRNAILTGVLFLVAILLTTGTLLFTDWNARSIWLMGILDIGFTISFIMAWIRYEMTRANIELIHHLQTWGQ